MREVKCNAAAYVSVVIISELKSSFVFLRRRHFHSVARRVARGAPNRGGFLFYRNARLKTLVAILYRSFVSVHAALGPAAAAFPPPLCFSRSRCLSARFAALSLLKLYMPTDRNAMTYPT